MNINLAKLFLVTAVTLSGCIISPEEKIAGTYAMDPGGVIIMVLREREGIHVVESFTLGEFDGGQNTYKVVGKEVHTFYSEEEKEMAKKAGFDIGGYSSVYKIETNGDLTLIAEIEDEKRTDYPKEEQITWKKTK